MHLRFPENLTAEEQAEFTCVNLIAHNVMRDEAKRKRDEVLPCWLCMSVEARQEARQMAADWYNANARPIVPIDVNHEIGLKQFERQLEPAAASMMQQWITAEAEFKRLRVEENNPRAFFCPC